MGIYFKQIKSVLVHKWYVFLAGLQVGVPLWRLIIHDLSKFSPTELMGYSRYHFGGDKRVKVWSKAWLHHLHHNDHHHEHWILSWNGNKSFYDGHGESIANYVTALRMSEACVREMVADMMGASKQRTGTWDITAWLNEHGPDMNLHPETVYWLRLILEQVGIKSEFPASVALHESPRITSLK